MDPNLFRYIWKHTRLQQIWVLAIVLLSMPTYFFALDLPKKIVNGPIQGTGYETSATQPFLDITIEFPDWLISHEPIQVFEGFQLDRFGMLYALSLAFLALVCINGLFKFYINTYKGRLGERMLRRLRYELVDRVLRFPMNQFRRVKPAEVATMVKDEVEPLGGFIGDAFVQPVFLGGQAITAMTFIVMQNFWLGLIAGSIVMVQAIFIPRLRRRLIELGRQRQLTARNLAGRVGEIVDGIASVHVNDMSNYERADISYRLGKIFKIRYEIFQRKFFVKFLNNLLAQMTPFLFYMIGGYFALTGRLDIGQLVAVIAAYKDLPSPIKELIDWDQQRLDVQVKYTQVIDQFSSDNMLHPDAQPVVLGQVDPLAGGFSISGLTAVDDSGSVLVDRLSLDVSLDEKVAIVGDLNSGADYLAEAMVRLLGPSAGKVSLAGEDIDVLPESVTGRRLGYASSDSALMQGSLRDNLLYSVKFAPPMSVEDEVAQDPSREWDVKEARRTGNAVENINLDWIDYATIGVESSADLAARSRRILETVQLDADVLNFGLRSRVDINERADFANQVLKARQGLHERLSEPEYAGLVEQFEPENYSAQATVGENLLFGNMISDELSLQDLARHPYLRETLHAEGLDELLFEMGKEIADTAIELFADLPPDHPFFEQLSFMTADQIPEYQAVLSRVQSGSLKDISPADRQQIMRLSFMYIEPRHRLGLLDDELRSKIVRARHVFRDNLPGELSDAIEFYDPTTYNRAASVQDNILFGRIAYGVAGGPERILELGRSVLEEYNLHDALLDVGLDFNVGSGGKRLSASQRQKLMLARALIKRPDLLIINRALSALDKQSQAQITRAIVEQARQGDFGLVWVLANAEMSIEFDRVIVLSDGRIVEDDSPEELKLKNGMFAKLLA